MSDFPMLEVDHESEDDLPSSPGGRSILLEVFHLEGRPFCQKVPDTELKQFWVLLGRHTSELKSVGQRIIPRRGLRITFSSKKH